MNFDKVVYVAHPYGGYVKNEEVVAKKLVKLQRLFPNTLFMSPVHCFSWAYKEVQYDVGMEMCYSLMEHCDEVWVTSPFWENSVGCTREVRRAGEWNIPVKFMFNLED